MDDRDTFLTNFEGMPMIFHKDKGTFNTVTVITKDFKNSVDFPIIKESQVFQTSFLYADISDELLAVKGKVKEMKNKIDSLVGFDADGFEKKYLEKMFEAYKEKYYLIEKKYSKERLNNELTKKKEELQLLELEIKLGEVQDVNDEQKNTIKKEIEKYNDLLRLITINIQKQDQ